jgi:deoxyribonucleoside regulator
VQTLRVCYNAHVAEYASRATAEAGYDRSCMQRFTGRVGRQFRLGTASTVVQTSALALGSMAGFAMSEREPHHIDAGEDRFQLADVARQYYLEDLTQEQIARGLGVSRSQVSRMLKVARERGIVEIRIHHPLRTAPELQERLLAVLPLSDTLVLVAAEESRSGSHERNASDEVARQLGALTARYLDHRIADHDIVGVGWGSTVYHVVTSGYFRRKQGISVVQLMGSVGGATPDIDGGQVATRLGRALGANIYHLHAPMVVTDAGVRAGLLRDQHIRKTLEMARRAGVLLVSVGAVTQASGIFRAGYLNETDLEYIQGQGAVGDICGVYFRQDGSPCSLELEERTIAAGGDAMRRAALRVGVGWGAAKALPSIGAI